MDARAKTTAELAQMEQVTCMARIPGAVAGSSFQCRLTFGHRGHCWAGRDVYFASTEAERAGRASKPVDPETAGTRARRWIR